MAKSGEGLPEDEMKKLSEVLLRPALAAALLAPLALAQDSTPQPPAAKKVPHSGRKIVLLPRQAPSKRTQPRLNPGGPIKLIKLSNL